MLRSRWASGLFAALGVSLLPGSGPAAELQRADILYVDFSNGRILGVDPATGDRSTISDASTGSGPDLVNPTGVTIDLDSFTIYVTDPTADAVFAVDPPDGGAFPSMGSP